MKFKCGNTQACKLAGGQSPQWPFSAEWDVRKVQTQSPVHSTNTLGPLEGPKLQPKFHYPGLTRREGKRRKEARLPLVTKTNDKISEEVIS